MPRVESSQVQSWVGFCASPQRLSLLWAAASLRDSSRARGPTYVLHFPRGSAFYSCTCHGSHDSALVGVVALCASSRAWASFVVCFMRATVSPELGMQLAYVPCHRRPMRVPTGCAVLSPARAQNSSQAADKSSLEITSSDSRQGGVGMLIAHFVQLFCKLEKFQAKIILNFKNAFSEWFSK